MNTPAKEVAQTQRAPAKAEARMTKTTGTLGTLAASLLLAAACQPADDPADDTGTAQPAETVEAVDDTQTGAPLALKEAWTLSGFSAPEGVAAAPDGGYFISNVVGSGDETDGSAWISRVSKDGEMIDPKFASVGMDAPKGMVVDRGILYVADLTRLHLIDPDDGTLLRTLDIEGAQGLNDMTSWNASVMVSDSQTGRIYRLSGDEAEIWLEDERLAGVNGLTADGDRLLVATMESGSLYETDESKTLTEIATGMKNADGIGVIDEGYVVSSWPGQIWFATDEGEVSELLNTQENGVLQNDLTIIDGRVIVPNWMPGTVTVWEIEAR